MKGFMKKEWLELVRTGRLWVLLLVFVFVGIMNPALAKLTPWMMELMSDQLVGMGLTTGQVSINAMDSWTQFYKNMPLALIAFLLMWSGSFTGEYEKGTLICVITRGLSRSKILAAKVVVMAVCWTALYGLCYGITYGYNSWFWDNGVACHLLFGAVCYWLFGLWTVGLLALFSVFSKNSIQVALGVGSVALAVYGLSFFPALGRVLPVRLTAGMELLRGAWGLEAYYMSLAVTCLLFTGCLLLAIPCFQRKQL